MLFYNADFIICPLDSCLIPNDSHMHTIPSQRLFTPLNSYPKTDNSRSQQLFKSIKKPFDQA